ncbi:sensor histidine kinase [Occallatibacter riparius]|uniref:histidine kinase n=1 Tax=Occallatibacter riparius TaxID=1002689 RepID=A0A9J7BNU2_9BACT|nr:two-component regulator propeller domain-containing protein [Occallatibacter riparius]UWZ84392.1 ATP-binding protein [Occallatibacter riparius]
MKMVILPPSIAMRILVCIFCLGVCAPARSLDRDRRLDQLYHTGWTQMEGAPGEVHALAQTTDGYLWLGAATGLFRFDGIRIERYTPQSGQAFPQRNVASLFAVPDGGLWVGYWYGGVSFIKNGTVINYEKDDGIPPRAVLAFARDRQGTIWIAAGKDGLARLEGSRWKKVGTDWGFSGEAYSLFVDHAGTVWVGTPTTVAYLVEGGHRFRVAAQHLKPFVHSFSEAPDGILWMAEGGYGVRTVPLSGKNSGRTGPAVLVGSLAIAFDSQGSLWITSAGNGIRRVPYPERLHPPKVRGPSAWMFHNAEVEAFTQKDGLTSDYVYSVLQDREGNVWIGTSGGLDRFQQTPVVSLPLQPISHRGALPIPSLSSFTASAIAADAHGGLWAAGRGPEVLLNIQDDRIATQLRDQNVDCAYRDLDGVVWVATWRSILRISDERSDLIRPKPGTVAYKYHSVEPVGQGQTLRQIDLPKAGGITVSEQSRVKALTRDASGRLWISTESGTFRLERSSWTSLESLGGPRGTANAEFTDSSGKIWFGFANQVAMLDGNRLRLFAAKDGVQVGTITTIQGRGANLWIGGEFGLESFDGSRFHPIAPSDGSAFDGVSGLVVDSEGGLWFSDNRGIIHISESELRQPAYGKVEFESFGVQDGLTTELRGPLASPSSVRTEDGRIWFATMKGLAWINPNRIVRNSVPPPVLIESVIANGKRYDNSADLTLPPRIANLQIVYTATSLTVPERVRFRYKLVGQDNEWQDVGTRREAFYTNLGPGSYQFRVIACNNDGVWNQAGTVIRFDVRPAFYQTITFRILCGIAIITTLWLFYLLRVRHIEQRQLERNRAEEMLRQARAELARMNRVSTMGELTASLAHEIKQPIGAAVTNAEACLRLINRDKPDLPEAREAALEMVKDARRAAEIIERVRSLFREGSCSPQERVDVNEVIRDMVVMFLKEADLHSVMIRTHLASHLPHVMVDRVQLQQALMNLMVNGIEAMRETTGELSIESQLGQDSRVLISVSDTGIGLPAGKVDHIFDAFFTTKSQGTGLGLAITRSIVESHGGRIWANANSGPGATFQFTLPITEGDGK